MSAVEPDENACRITNKLSGAAALARSCAASTDSAAGQPPAHRTRPITTITNTDMMNAYVGTAKRMPASLTPLRFASVSRTMNPAATATACSATAGKAEEIATTPAVIDTDTVST